MIIQKNLFLFFLLFFFIFEDLNSIENKILLKVNNNIITTIDVLNEINYLNVVNVNFKNFEKNKIFEIAKDSLIRQKIKEEEISKYTDNLSINEEYLEEIIESIYKDLNINNFEDFTKYLNKFNLEVEYLKNRISTDIIWNNLILTKFLDKVKIDENKIKSDLKKNISKTSFEYSLSEIIFNTPFNSSFEEKLLSIENDIKEKGFESAALIHSISSTSSKNGGKIGWINEDSLNPAIKKILAGLNKEDYTKPLIVPGGFLILKINDVKIVKNENIDINKKFEEIVNTKKNEQLNNYSNIYFNKIQKEYIINEK